MDTLTTVSSMIVSEFRMLFGNGLVYGFPPSGGNVLVDAWLATEGHIAALDGQWMAAKWKL